MHDFAEGQQREIEQAQGRADQTVVHRVESQPRQYFKQKERRKGQRQHQHAVFQRSLDHAIPFRRRNRRRHRGLGWHRLTGLNQSGMRRFAVLRPFLPQIVDEQQRQLQEDHRHADEQQFDCDRKTTGRRGRGEMRRNWVHARILPAQHEDLMKRR